LQSLFTLVFLSRSHTCRSTYVPHVPCRHRQRCQYKLKCDGKHNTLTDERQEMLEEMGFVWDSHNASWELRFNELCDFKRVHGHTFVPTIYPQNPQLAAWIKVRFIIHQGTRKVDKRTGRERFKCCSECILIAIFSYLLSTVSTKAAQDFPWCHGRAMGDTML
jgi:hypothetical protein